jgi:hypothetical protein
MSEFVNSPNECAGKSRSTKGGPGVYNGEPGYEKRTSSPNAVPEKTYEEQRPFATKPTAADGLVVSPVKER